MLSFPSQCNNQDSKTVAATILLWHIEDTANQLYYSFPLHPDTVQNLFQNSIPGNHHYYSVNVGTGT